MKNLDDENVLCDNSPIGLQVLQEVSDKLEVIFNKKYLDFVMKHNGASIIIRCFHFYNNSIQKVSADSVAFLDVSQIVDDIESLLRQTTEDENDPDLFKFYHYFDRWLIPFGENGGGDFICFDYRENHKTDNPPIIFWSHDAANPDGRISFIANNFEEFINMLYEPEDAKEDRKNWKGW